MTASHLTMVVSLYVDGDSSRIPNPESIVANYNPDPTQRIFKYGSSIDLVCEAIGITAAIGSGVSMALINLVLGQFIDVLTRGTQPSTDLSPDYMANVTKFS